MIDVSWLLFVPAALLLIIVPGQDMMIVMSRSVAQGSLAGVVTAAGVALGLMGHTILATLGLGAILRTSEWLFLALKIAGAIYLIYLGISLLRSGRTELALPTDSIRPLPRLFLDGAFCNIANPKIAVFYLAFLPQFVAPDAAYPALSVFVLGVAYAVLAFVVKGPVGVAAGVLSQWLRRRPDVLTWVYRVSGAVLVGLALKLALTRQTA